MIYCIIKILAIKRCFTLYSLANEFPSLLQLIEQIGPTLLFFCFVYLLIEYKIDRSHTSVTSFALR
ncbi:hypothetical protein BDF14DRAFT_1790203 [Spinellus fusiger]|nr:hypothetical protein BDF14DRAFT_1790203 [Spinellus fusiger]